MNILHATLKRNLRAIQKEGLRPDKSRGKLQVVWLHTAARTTWAILHTQYNHKAKLDDVAILSVQVPKSWLTRSRRGLWHCARRISPAHIATIAPATIYAQ